jgi:hypothetical protein
VGDKDGLLPEDTETKASNGVLSFHVFNLLSREHSFSFDA